MRRNLGKFLISMELIEDNPKFVQKVMSECIPVRAEMRYDSHAIEYIAMSRFFDIVPQGQVVPEYMIHCMQNKNGKVRWNFWPIHL